MSQGLIDILTFYSAKPAYSKLKRHFQDKLKLAKSKCVWGGVGGGVNTTPVSQHVGEKRNMTQFYPIVFERFWQTVVGLNLIDMF